MLFLKLKEAIKPLALGNVPVLDFYKNGRFTLTAAKRVVFLFPISEMRRVRVLSL